MRSAYLETPTPSPYSRQLSSSRSLDWLLSNGKHDPKTASGRLLHGAPSLFFARPGDHETIMHRQRRDAFSREFQQRRHNDVALQRHKLQTGPTAKQRGDRRMTLADSRLHLGGAPRVSQACLCEFRWQTAHRPGAAKEGQKRDLGLSSAEAVYSRIRVLSRERETTPPICEVGKHGLEVEVCERLPAQCYKVPLAAGATFATTPRKDAPPC